MRVCFEYAQECMRRKREKRGSHPTLEYTGWYNVKYVDEVAYKVCVT